MALSALVPGGKGGPRRTGGKRAGAGRPTGAATRITRDRADEIAKSGKAPLDIMLDNMLFWHQRVQDTTSRLENLVVDIEDPEERREAFGLVKELLGCRENAQKCAVDLAPYVHPRLAAITMKTPTPDADPNALPVDSIEASRAYQRLLGSG